MKLSQFKLVSLLHFFMATVGGFFGVYSIMLRNDFFGSAQTSNLIYLVTALLGHNFPEVLLRIGGVFLYFLAGVIYVLISKKTFLNTKILAICIDIVAAIFLCFIPLNIDPILGLYPSFFAMSFQWNSFAADNGFACSTIFSTNNLRQVSVSLTNYLLEGQREQLKKYLFFLGTMIFFHCGVAFGYLTVIKYANIAIIFSLLPLSIALWLALLEVKYQKG